MSDAIESMSFRTFSARPSARFSNTLPIFVTPSVIRATSAPNSLSRRSRERSVSSTVSWRSAAATVTSSIRMSLAAMSATSSGCEM